MNAFPAELVQHHYACMLVAGLLPLSQQQQQQLAQQGAAVATNVTTPPLGAASEKAATTPPSDPPLASSSAANKHSYVPSQRFPQLAGDLCDVFASRGRSAAWDAAKANSAVFHSVLVDHNARLPPRKTRPTPRTLAATPAAPQSTAAANLQPRSPLSPLHPSSPLFPDGVIAPIWLRKHRELVPAVFVAFYCLAEHTLPAPPPTPPKDGATEEEKPRAAPPTQGLTGAELKAKDEELIRIISDRKRLLSERGIKLTVVLLTTRAMLESATLEQRLSFIRRSSQLDAKASLFVLTPVSKSELSDFVTSLQSALYEPAMDYYREQYRRVRRKRSKYPPSPSTVAQIMTVAAEIRGSPIKDNALSREGWLARSDYKMGTFAELQGHLDEAFKHYTDAYNLLATEMLTSTLLLPPRTKRWAEAKVLADTLSFRISKLLLYRDDGDGAWDQFRAHVRRFTELSQGWGIGEMTFEFWSWLGKQYRLMGDLLDLAMRDTPNALPPLPAFRPSQHFPPLPTYLLHPSHLPMPTASGNAAISHNPQHGNLAAPNDAAMASGVVPAEMCPGAGECFYIAGVCALERWERFRRLVWEQEQQAAGAENGEATSMDSWGSTNLSQERKVDHAAQAIEALTRAHEVFKRQRRHRLSLFVASKIANAYLEAQQNELALRFLERTAKSYQLEGWPAPLVSQLLLALSSSQSVKDAESEGRALWRLLGAGVSLEKEQRAQALTELVAWCKAGNVKEDKRPLRIECTRDDGPLLARVVFSKGEADLDGSAVAYQVCIATSQRGGLDGISFDRLTIHLHDGEGKEAPTLTVLHKEDSSASTFASLDPVDLRSAADTKLDVGAAKLSWPSNTTRVFEGKITPRRLGLLQVVKLALERDGDAPVCLEFDVQNDEEAHGDFVQPAWYVPLTPMRTQPLPYRADTSGVEVRRRTYKLKMEVQHDPDAMLDEHFPVTVSVTNEDSTAMQCTLDVHVLGPPGEVMSADEVWSGKERDEGAALENTLRDVALGTVEAGGVVRHQFTLMCKRHLLPRTVDIVLRSREAASERAADAEDASSETIASIALPVGPSLSSSFYAQWRLLRSKPKHRPSITTENGTVVTDVTARNEAPTAVEEISALAVSADDMAYVTAVASLNVGLHVLARDSIEIVNVTLKLDADSRHLRMWQADDTAATGGVSTQETVAVSPDKWRTGDRWGGVFDIEVLSESVVGMMVEADDASVRPTGLLQVQWRRIGDDEKTIKQGDAALNMTTLSLPLLLPPHLLARLVVSLPASTTTENPLVMLITIVNPSRLAADIFIHIDDANADFALQSHRSFTVPNLLPRSTRSVPVHVVPRRSVALHAGSAPSVRTLPRVRAWQRDRRQAAAAAAPSTRTSLDSVAAASVVSAGVARQGELLQIVNQRPGVGVPLEVSLRYTSKTAGGVGTTADGAAVVLPGTAAAPRSGTTTTTTEPTPSQTIDVAAHLQAETQRTGMWTIFVH